MILLDTHVLVWLAEGSQRLGNRTKKLIDGSFNVDGVMVSAISFWEIAMLIRKNRLHMEMDLDSWRDELISMGLVELGITGEIGIKAAGLANFHGDPADRLIAATALKHSLTLVTADKKLLKTALAVKVMDASI